MRIYLTLFELAEASFLANDVPRPCISFSLDILSSLVLEKDSLSSLLTTFARCLLTIPFPRKASHILFLDFRLPLGKSSWCDSKLYYYHYPQIQCWQNQYQSYVDFYMCWSGRELFNLIFS